MSNRRKLRATGTGIKVEARHKYGAPLPEPTGAEHLWVVTAAWVLKDPTQVTQADGQIHLDTENLLTLAGPGCFHCEQEYTPELAAQACKGEPI